jgi:hypothetical protein
MPSITIVPGVATQAMGNRRLSTATRLAQPFAIFDGVDFRHAPV